MSPIAITIVAAAPAAAGKRPPTIAQEASGRLNSTRRPAVLARCEKNYREKKSCSCITMSSQKGSL